MQETLGELRIHADDLRQQYNEMLQRWESRYVATAGATAATGDATSSSKSELLLRYMELSRLRDELWAENQQLHDAFEDREKSVFRLQRLFDVNYQLVRVAGTVTRCLSLSHSRTRSLVCV